MNEKLNREEKFVGVIIEESLANKNILKNIKIIKTKVEQATERHKTPWLKQWTLNTFEISENQADEIAEQLRASLESEHPWYVDFKNKILHFIVFRDKIFKIDRTSKNQYDEAKSYGISLGIPAYQVDFHPDTAEWKR